MQHTVRISSRSAFLQKARTSCPVSVVRYTTVVPQEQNETIVMVPAVALEYWFDFHDNIGTNRWTFREVLLADASSYVSMANTLLNTLEATLEPDCINRVQRSGSF